MIMKRLIFILCIVLSVQACNDDDPVCGGPCSYDTIPGSATITLIVPDTLNYRLCANAVVVYFDFIPDNSSAPDNYTYPDWPDANRRIYIADGKNPPSSWIEALGFTVGTEHPCIRLEEIKGTCTPVLFTFPGIDYSSWKDYCD